MKLKKRRSEENAELNVKISKLEEAMRRSSGLRPKQKTLIQLGTNENAVPSGQLSGRSSSKDQPWTPAKNSSNEETTQTFSKVVSQGDIGQNSSQDSRGWQKSVQEELKEAAERANKIELEKQRAVKQKKKEKSGMKS